MVSSPVEERANQIFKALYSCHNVDNFAALLHQTTNVNLERLKINDLLFQGMTTYN